MMIMLKNTNWWFSKVFWERESSHFIIS